MPDTFRWGVAPWQSMREAGSRVLVYSTALITNSSWISLSLGDVFVCFFYIYGSSFSSGSLRHFTRCVLSQAIISHPLVYPLHEIVPNLFTATSLSKTTSVKSCSALYSLILTSTWCPQDLLLFHLTKICDVCFVCRFVLWVFCV